MRFRIMVPGELKRALVKLQKRSLIVFRKFTDSYSVFEGSDFDIDYAVDLALATIDEVDYGRLNVSCRGATCCCQASLPRDGSAAVVRCSRCPFDGFGRRRSQLQIPTRRTRGILPDHSGTRRG